MPSHQLHKASVNLLFACRTLHPQSAVSVHKQLQMHGRARKQPCWLSGDSWVCITALGRQARQQKNWRLLGSRWNSPFLLSYPCVRVWLHIYRQQRQATNVHLSGSSQQRSSKQQWSSNIQQHGRSTVPPQHMSHSDGSILRLHAINGPLSPRCGATCNKAQHTNTFGDHA
jgi:hypothetical protein